MVREEGGAGVRVGPKARSGIKAPERGLAGRRRKGLERSSGFKVRNHEVKDGKMGTGKRKERRNVEAGFNEVTDHRALGSESVGWSVIRDGTQHQEARRDEQSFWSPVAP